ncbi:MAG: hypothetical protein ACOVS5_12615, partial [Oligoflexus sp.]
GRYTRGSGNSKERYWTAYDIESISLLYASSSSRTSLTLFVSNLLTPAAPQTPSFGSLLIGDEQSAQRSWVHYPFSCLKVGHAFCV